MTISGLVFKIILDHGRAAVNKQLAAGKQSVHAVIAAKHHYVRIGARTDNALFAGKARHARRIFREERKRRFKGNAVYLLQPPKLAQQRFWRCVCYAGAVAVRVKLGLAAACIAAHGYARGVRALLQHRDGLMLDVATILTSLRLRMNEMSARSVGSGRALVSLVFQVHNLTELQNVMARLRGISGVSAVRRAEG